MPDVHGWFSTSPHCAAPVPLSSWGMHSSFVESHTARLFGVPRVTNSDAYFFEPIASSTFVFVRSGLYPSSLVSRTILRPPMPPLSLMYLKYALAPSASRPNPASGPDVGRLVNRWISVSVMPCLGSQSAGQFVGSISKPDVPL